MKEKDKFRDSEIQQPDNSRLAKEIRRRQAQKDRFMTKMDRLFGFILLSALILGCAGLGLLYILEKGPSESLRDSFVMTMQETRRFDFISNIFLEQETINEIKSAADDSAKYVPVAKTMQNIETASLSAHEVHVELAQDDDGDGIIFEEIKGGGYLGYMITVLDPTRIIIGTPDSFGGVGWTMEDLVKKYDAIGGINGGGFKDEGGTGSGGQVRSARVPDWR